MGYRIPENSLELTKYEKYVVAHSPVKLASNLQRNHSKDTLIADQSRRYCNRRSRTPPERNFRSRCHFSGAARSDAQCTFQHFSPLSNMSWWRSTAFLVYGMRQFGKKGYEALVKEKTFEDLTKMDLKQKSIMITGANAGLGFSTCLWFAKQGSTFRRVRGQ